MAASSHVTPTTGNLDDDGLPAARMREFHREYGKHGWIVNYHSNMTMFDDRRTYLTEQVAQILMGKKGLDFFPTKAKAQDLGIHSGWTEIFAVSLNQIRGYQGKAVQICKSLNWNFKKIFQYIKNFCQTHFGSDNYAEYKYGEKVPCSEKKFGCKRDFIVEEFHCRLIPLGPLYISHNTRISSV